MSKCALHTEVDALVTCKRCGRFCCRQCLPALETCWACVVWFSEQVPPLPRHLPMVLHALRVAFAFLALGFALMRGYYYPLAAVGLCLLLDVLVAWPFYRWLKTAAEHAVTRGAALDGDTPGEVAATWFLPYGWWKASFQIVEIFSVARARGFAVRLWPIAWFLALLGEVLVVASLRTRAITLDGLRMATVACVVSAVLSVVNLRALRFERLEVPEDLKFPVAR